MRIILILIVTMLILGCINAETNKKTQNTTTIPTTSSTTIMQTPSTTSIHPPSTITSSTITSSTMTSSTMTSSTMTSSTMTSSTMTSSTTLLPPPSISPTTTLPTTLVDCIESAGYRSDGAFYAFKTVCGNKWADTVDTISKRTGVYFTKVNVGLLKENEIKLLECFLGDYEFYQTSFDNCPMLYCSRTGDAHKISPSAPAYGQIRSFAMSCR